MVLLDPRALRLAPGSPYRPQSGQPESLARFVWLSCAQCRTVREFVKKFYNTVVLGSVPSWDRRIECIPLVLHLDQPQELWNERAARVAVGHDDGPVSLTSVRSQVALESPVAAAVREIPSLAQLQDAEAYGI